MIFDPSNKRIILDTNSVSTSEIWSRWTDWLIQSDNLKYLPALSQVGGEDLGSGISISIYIFLLNGWRVRPMESNHQLTITGNLFVEGGGVPLVNTLGNYNVIAQYTVPVQAQAVQTSASSLTTADIINAMNTSYPNVNLEKINGIQLSGTGVDGDSWRPA